MVTDAALQVELMEGSRGRSAYWMMRRSTRLLQMLTAHADLSDYRQELDEAYAAPDEEMFPELYRSLQEHGFPMIPPDEARERSIELRRGYDAQLEFLIDLLEAPRGFWGHHIGHRLETSTGVSLAD